MSKKQNKQSQKLSPAQREARIEAARKRQEAEKQKQERSARRKQIFTIVVCVILVLALGVPTVALQFMSAANNAATNENTNNANIEGPVPASDAAANSATTAAQTSTPTATQTSTPTATGNSTTVTVGDENSETITVGGDEEPATEENSNSDVQSKESDSE